MASNCGVAEQVLSLPRGGGDVKGLGEKPSPDPHTGTGTCGVPLPVPPGRRGLPTFALTYNTCMGNGPLRLGWSITPPAAVLKTDKGIPRYDDAQDTAIVSGWEDLVPISGGGCRPRVDTTFARIRHIQSAGEDYWVVIRTDGLRHVYGRSQEAPMYDDSTGRRRTFAWFLTKTTDTCGTKIIHQYKSDRDPDPPRSMNQSYLKAMYYIEYAADAAGPDGRR